ncbi:MAG TPA: hypothetical protein VGT41_05815 [Candidatus Babeliales bacterium]|nr:hypothetical protein [Candidatus Babeliales bacterium]
MLLIIRANPNFNRRSTIVKYATAVRLQKKPFGSCIAFTLNYTYEYWHFSCGDRYAAYWQESDPTKRVAYYGVANY